MRNRIIAVGPLIRTKGQGLRRIVLAAYFDAEGLPQKFSVHMQTFDAEKRAAKYSLGHYFEISECQDYQDSRVKALRDFAQRIEQYATDLVYEGFDVTPYKNWDHVDAA
jgi:hypothetical protein